MLCFSKQSTGKARQDIMKFEDSTIVSNTSRIVVYDYKFYEWCLIENENVKSIKKRKKRVDDIV